MAQVDVFDGPDAVEWEHREIASLLVEELDGGADSIRAHVVALAKEIGADAVVIQRVYATSPNLLNRAADNRLHTEGACTFTPIDEFFQSIPCKTRQMLKQDRCLLRRDLSMARP